jgi:hypothetical protein
MSDHVREFVRQLEIQNAKLQDILEHGSLNFRRYRRRATIAFVVLYVACGYTAFLQYERARDTARAAKAACVRSQKIGPPFIDGLERSHVLSPRWIKYYRDSIPKTCPK